MARTMLVAGITAVVVTGAILALAQRENASEVAPPANDVEVAALLRRVGLLEEQVEVLAAEAVELRLDAVEARLAAETARRRTPAGADRAPPAPAPSGQHEAELARLLEELRSKSENPAFNAAIKLGKLKDQRASTALIEVLQAHSDFYVRMGAATALGDIHAEDAVPALIDALDETDVLVRTAAHDALERITQRKAEFRQEFSARERAASQAAWRAWWQENTKR